MNRRIIITRYVVGCFLQWGYRLEVTKVLP